MSFLNRLRKIVQETIEDCLQKNLPAPEYLSTQQVAVYMSVSTAWLEQSRSNGDGPPFVKLARLVRYKRSDLDVWMISHRRNAMEVER